MTNAEIRIINKGYKYDGIFDYFKENAREKALKEYNEYKTHVIKSGKYYRVYVEKKYFKDQKMKQLYMSIINITNKINELLAEKSSMEEEIKIMKGI